jgi:5-oxopent-3-ene-1,2,5-tricarboxylate decarboxylase/2-hydroxyhepta-2,4-diene-1,7-dioate isomerase
MKSGDRTKPDRVPTIYAAALNFKGNIEKLGDALYRDPYKKPPQAPVLSIKTPNCRIGNGDSIPCPAGVDYLRMGGTLAVVIGQGLSIAGYTIANDVSVPHESYYRPPVKQRCRDGFCPIGPVIAELPEPDKTEIRIRVDGRLTASNSTGNLVRSIPRLIADISEFLTLSEGDLLLVGEPENAPLARPGQRVSVEIDGIGVLENPIVREQGEIRSQSFELGAIFALGLNYSDHAKELAFKAPSEPLIFLKGPNTLCGDRSFTRRPPDVTYMHYECELVVLIGKKARRVKRENAYDYVAGYQVANDYAIRDYLENYYRPNFRVKSRDNSTPIGRG